MNITIMLKTSKMLAYSLLGMALSNTLHAMNSNPCTTLVPYQDQRATIEAGIKRTQDAVIREAEVTNIFLESYDFFCTIVKTIADSCDINNQLSLENATHNILNLGSLNKTYFSYFQELFSSYSSGPKDTASAPTKVLRYIINKKTDFTKEEVMLFDTKDCLRSDREALKELAKNINKVTNRATTAQDIAQGQLLREISSQPNVTQAQDALAILFNQSCTIQSAFISRLFMQKIKIAFGEDILGLRNALTYQSNNYYGPTMLVSAIKKNAEYMVDAILETLHTVFINDMPGLQQALGQLTYFKSTVLSEVAKSDSPQIVKSIFKCLQAAFANDQQGLKNVLLSEDSDGCTTLMRATCGYGSEKIQALYIYHSVFIDDAASWQAFLTHQNSHHDSLLTWMLAAYPAAPLQDLNALLNELEATLAHNPAMWRRALTQQDNYNGNTPLIRASRYRTIDEATSILNALKRAFVNDPCGLLNALNQRDHSNSTALQLASTPAIRQLIQDAIDQAQAMSDAQQPN